MRKNTYLLVPIILIFTLLSCSKDKDSCDPEDKESPCYAGPVNDQYLSMKIDGTFWEASGPTHLFFVESPNMEVDTETGVAYYTMAFVGLQGELNGITVGLNLPADKFSDPRGSYPIFADPRKVMYAGMASVHLYGLYGNQGEFTSMFPESIDDDEPMRPDSGILTITDFELGNSETPGMQNRLYSVTGTFSTSTVYGFDLNGFNGRTQSIGEGKFKLINALYQN